MNTQISYKKTGNGHMFMGSDRLSTGVMAGGEDLLKAFDEVKKQLEISLADNHQIKATATCTIDRDKLAAYLQPLPAAVLLWQLDVWK